MTSSATRVVLVGTGAIAETHARTIGDDRLPAELVGAVSRDAALVSRFGKRWGASPYTDVAAALDAERPDLVVVCTESGRHAPAAIEALSRGCHVLIEKPAAVNLADVDRIADAAASADRLVGVVSQHRFDPATEAVAAAIARGELGRLTSAMTRLAAWRSQEYYDSAAWRGTWALDGGGALMNQGIHVIDVLLALMGPAVHVAGRIDRLAHDRIETEDIAVGTVEFASGALGIVHASTAAGSNLGSRIEIHGTRGSAVIDGDRLVWLGDAPVDGAPPTDSLARQYRNVLGAIRGREALRVGLADNRAAIALITALYDSAGGRLRSAQ